MPPTITGTRVVNRSAKTGEFVSDRYAKKHPSTTEREHRPVKHSPPKKGNERLPL